MSPTTQQAALSPQTAFTPQALLNIEVNAQSAVKFYVPKNPYQNQRGSLVIPLGLTNTIVNLEACF
jgi:hypothetical protein